MLKAGYPLSELIWLIIELKFFSLIGALRFSFLQKGNGTIVHYKSRINGSNYISLGKNVFIQKDVWLNVPLHELKRKISKKNNIIKIGDRSRVGKGSTISAINSIDIENDCLIGLNVTIVDHMHSFQDITTPILDQGVISRGKITLKSGCWIASNVVIMTSGEDIEIGKNSIVSANSVVKKNVEDYTIVSGNPAKEIKRFNHKHNKWIDVNRK